MGKSLSYNEFTLGRPEPKKPVPLKELQEQAPTRVPVSDCNFYDVTEAEKEWDEIETQFRAILIRAEADIEKWAIRANSFRDRRGYRLMGYRSWELFCSKRLNYTSSWIDKVIRKALPAPLPDQDEEPEPEDQAQEPKAHQPSSPEPDEAPEPDPWQSIKQEVMDVYAPVNASFKQLKETLQWARGHAVFDFVSQEVEQDVGNLLGTIKLAKPTDKCPTCRAQTPEQAKSCRTCKTIGLVPKQIAERGR